VLQCPIELLLFVVQYFDHLRHIGIGFASNANGDSYGVGQNVTRNDFDILFERGREKQCCVVAQAISCESATSKQASNSKRCMHIL
jgi:hypothetical protein